MIVDYLNLRAGESRAVPGSARASGALRVRFPILKL
jgi:hypothetical protein